MVPNCRPHKWHDGSFGGMPLPIIASGTAETFRGRDHAAHGRSGAVWWISAEAKTKMHAAAREGLCDPIHESFCSFLQQLKSWCPPAAPPRAHARARAHPRARAAQARSEPGLCAAWLKSACRGAQILNSAVIYSTAGIYRTTRASPLTLTVLSRRVQRTPAAARATAMDRAKGS